jgi:arylformamidase
VISLRIIDISMNIHHDMTVYGNYEHKRPNIKVVKDHSEGSVYESRIDMDMHTGAHIDAPLHMIKDGSTMESIDLNKCFTKCKVLDLTNVEDKINVDDLQRKNISSGDFILLKTQNSIKGIPGAGFVFVEKSGAEYLRDKGIIGVGIDSTGIERSQPGHETHKALLGNGIIILEGLDLKEVKEGEYFLAALPLKIAGVEAAPVRAVLVEGI